MKGNVTWNGTAYSDSCVEFRIVKEYYCKDGKAEAINTPCDAGYGCENGACVWQPFECSETDAGNDNLVKGRTVVTKGLNTPFDETDACENEAYVNENYCLENGTAVTETVPCESGTKCVQGRCVDSMCSDTDDGLNYFKRGVASAGGDSYEDNCFDDYTIQEYYCYGDEVRDKITGCPDGYICSQTNKKCVEGSIG